MNVKNTNILLQNRFALEIEKSYIRTIIKSGTIITELRLLWTPTNDTRITPFGL